MLICITKTLFEICCILVAIPMYIALGAIVYIVAYGVMCILEKPKHRTAQPRHNGKRSY